MVSRVALVDEAGQVVNVIVCDIATYQPAKGLRAVAADADAEPGGMLKDGAFSRAPVRVRTKAEILHDLRALDVPQALDPIIDAEDIAKLKTEAAQLLEELRSLPTPTD